MHVNVRQFWVNGPPPGIREGLLESGLVVPQAIPKSRTKKIIPQPSASVSDRNFSNALPPRLLPKKNIESGRQQAPVSPMKLQYPKQPRIAQTVSNPAVMPPRIPYRAQTSFGNRAEKNDDFNFESPQKHEELDFFGESTRKKGYVSRKESKELFDQINRLSQVANNEIEKLKPGFESKNNDEDITSILCSYLEKFYLLWDDLILQVKVSNADHATALCLIKTYMQNVMKSLPNLAKRYENQIMQIQDTMVKIIEERDFLKNENNDLIKQGEVDRTKIEECKEMINNLNQELDNMRAEKKELLYQVDELKQMQTETNFRISKLEETKKQMSQTIEADKQKFSDIRKQNSMLDQLVKKYEEEGASYRPMYTKACDELHEAQSTIQDLKATIEKLSYKPTVADIGIECFIEPSPKVDTTGKKRKGTLVKGEKTKISEDSSFRFTRKEKQLTRNISQASVGSSDEMFYSSKNISLPTDVNPPLSLNKFNISMNGKNDSISSLLSSFEEQRAEEEKAQMKEDANENKEEKQPENVQQENKEEEQKPKEEKTQKEEEMKKKEEDIVETIVVDQNAAYPEGYSYNPNLIKQMPTIRTYLFRILPTAINTFIDASDFNKIYSTTREIGVKSMTYTLGTSINILRNGFKFNSDPISEKTKFKDIVRQSLIDNGINLEILDKTEATFMTSAIHYRAVSKTIDFFLKFAAGEYSIADFGFFNMLFSLTFSSLYPNVEEVVSDPDISDDSVSFMFPFEGIDHVCSILLPERMMTKEMKDELLKRSVSPEFKSMISFWDFATAMVELFDNVHQTFHQTVKNIFRSLGSNDVYNVSQGRFTEFVRVLFPNMDEKSISQSWKKVVLFADQMSTETVNYNVLLHFFGETPSFCESILKIPLNTSFDAQFRAMQDRVDNLFTFLRKRYTDFMPRLKLALPEELRNKIDPYIEKIRNALLRCDAGTVYVYYRHILQSIDIYLTEQNPYIQFTANVNPDEINDLINITVTREKLITERLFID